MNLVDGFLRRDEHPRFAVAFARQVMLQRLEIQHHVGIITDVLADFINAENNMMVVSLAFNVLLHEFGKIFGADAVFFTYAVTPAASSVLTHNTLLNHRLNKSILLNINTGYGIFPVFKG